MTRKALAAIALSAILLSLVPASALAGAAGNDIHHHGFPSGVDSADDTLLAATAGAGMSKVGCAGAVIGFSHALLIAGVTMPAVAVAGAFIPLLIPVLCR